MDYSLATACRNGEFVDVIAWFGWKRRVATVQGQERLVYSLRYIALKLSKTFWHVSRGAYPRERDVTRDRMGVPRFNVSFQIIPVMQ